MSSLSEVDRFQPPPMVLPGLSATRVTLAHTPHLIATLEGFRVWPQGVEFELHLQTDGTVRDRSGEPARADFDLRSGNADDLVELGVAHDGRRTSNVSAHTWPGRAAGDAELVLTLRGGGGGCGRSGGKWRVAWWLTPLPTAGPVEFQVRWASGGLPQSTTLMDAELLSMAADAAGAWRTGPGDTP